MNSNVAAKPLGRKNYGSIAHLPNSRIGKGDHHVHEGQAVICTQKARDKWDTVYVHEKLDGSNVGVAKVGGAVVALGRAGFLAQTSPFKMHHLFAEWVRRQTDRFAFLAEGERLVGEWLIQAHGTRYALKHEPFVAFDLMRGDERATQKEFTDRVIGQFVTPKLLSVGDAMPLSEALYALGEFGHHGALEQVEGVVYRVERTDPATKRRYVDFLAKWVRPDKVDGSYLERDGGAAEPTWNVTPEELFA